jgi:hypothetical protein
MPGATSIGSYAFSGCSSLIAVDIPSNATSIGDGAFQSCSKMDSVSIGANVASIGASAFDGCSKLSKITTYRLTPATLGSNVFNGVNTQTCKLCILQEADFDAYFNAPKWGSFLNLVRINPSGLPTLINFPFNNLLKVYNTPSEIIVEGTSKGEEIVLYTVSGLQLKSILSAGERISIPAKSGCAYLVKTKEKTYKVML